MKRSIKTIATILCASLIVGNGIMTGGSEVFADGIEINSSNFPDDNFRSYISAVIDESGDEVLSQSEINAVTDIYVIAAEVSNLKGIEKFTNLEVLDCSSNAISSLNLSSNTKLKELKCNDNKLTSLDISKNPSLEVLDITGNSIASIDVKNNTYLTRAYNAGVTKDDDYNICFYEDDAHDCYLKYDLNCKVIAGAASTPTAAPTTVTSAPTTATTAAPTTTLATVTSSPNNKKDVAAFVDRCYQVALGRKADEDGYWYWLNALTKGEACGAQVGYGFIFSGEYISRNTSNEQYVTDLYSMFFGRAKDDAGFKYWVGLLESGSTREEVFAGFANSQEFSFLCQDYGVVAGYYLKGVDNSQQGGVNCYAARLYKICLNRLPDPGGQAGWVEKLMAGEVTGTTCAYGFVFSPEFVGRNLKNSDFVIAMYAAFFGREGEFEDITGWSAKLEEGMTREDVFYGFANSAEFAQLCSSYGIKP